MKEEINCLETIKTLEGKKITGEHTWAFMILPTHRERECVVCGRREIFWTIDAIGVSEWRLTK
jgi:hypothetical protein